MTYTASADITIAEMGKFSKNYGFTGLAFNMLDSRNYEVLYVRPHSRDFCWELGRVEDGQVYSRDFGNCGSAVRRSFNVGVKMENGKGLLSIFYKILVYFVRF